jgi:alpha-tubulin suppressor-like RCC1 family protein
MGTVDGFDDLTSSPGPTVVCARRTDDTAWCWGYNEKGQIGDGTNEARSTPTQVVNLSGVKMVAAGYWRTYAVLEDGTIWHWGSGLGPIPSTFSGLDDVMSVSAGNGHLCATKSDGTVWCWGTNLDGELGNGTTSVELSDLPTQVIGLANVVSVAAGQSITCAVTESGDPWCWGRDLFNADIHPTPVPVAGLSGVQEIALGVLHACALMRSGEVHCWGAGDYGELGNGSTEDATAPVKVEKLSDVVDLSVQGCFAGAVTADGTLWGWGCLGGEENTLPLAAKTTDPGIARDFEGQRGYYAMVPYPFADPR